MVTARGIKNAALFGGIADAETGLAHCWSEATWACQGPWSSSCGGPVIAGAGDGPCAIREGGLGMFQFDGGNFDQTLARDGQGILTVEGNVDRAVDFVIGMVIRSHFIPQAHDVPSAVDFLNSVPIAPGNPNYEAWISTVTRYYNGCPQNGSCWASRRANYERLTRGIYHEMGGDSFWGRASQPPPDPAREAGRGCGGLSSNEYLPRGRNMISCGGLYNLVHQEDGNVVLYAAWSGQAVWATGTDGRSTDQFIMQHDGNLVLYAPGGEPIWDSGTHGNYHAALEVQDDGNLVVYSPGPRGIWESGTAGAGGTPPAPEGCGILNADKGLGRDEGLNSCTGNYYLVFQGDGNVVLYNNSTGRAIWHTATHGQSSDWLVMQGDGNFVLYGGGRPLWATGTEGRGGAYLAVQDDGNVVIYTADRRAVWASGTNGQ